MRGSDQGRGSDPRLRQVAPWLFAVALVAGWALLVALTRAPAWLLPSPSDVAARLASDLVNPTLWPYLGTTAVEAVGGCLLGAAVALPLAIGIHRSRLLSAALMPFLGATQAIPAVALAPLLVLWIGYGFASIVLLCALLVFFPILVASVVGLRHVNASVTDAARVDGANGLALLRHIELPLALPSILAGLRNGFALSVTGAVVGEMVMGGAGLGQLLMAQQRALDTAGLVATILVLCLLASGLYGFILVLERRSSIVQTLSDERR